MTTSTFKYHAPDTVSDALKLLESYGETAKILAGGHSLIPIMKLRLAEPEVLIDLRNVENLSGISEVGDDLIIGSMTTYFELMESEIVNRKMSVLSEAVALVADVQVRNRGTIGGSVCHADPAGDLPGVLVGLASEFQVTSSNGTRVIAAEDMFVDLLTTALQPDEILTAIKIPAINSGTGASYEKIANKASRYAIVGVCAVITSESGKCTAARISVTGAGATAVRAKGSEVSLIGISINDDAINAAASVAAEDIDCLEDIHASAEYRSHLTKVAARRAITKAAQRAI